MRNTQTNETMRTSKIVSWKTSKNQDGTFTATCWSFESTNEINEITGNYTTPNQTLWTGTFSSRAIAKARVIKAVKYFFRSPIITTFDNAGAICLI